MAYILTSGPVLYGVEVDRIGVIHKGSEAVGTSQWKGHPSCSISSLRHL